MRLNWMYGALLAAAIVSPSSAQISVYIGTPPPAIVYEEPGPPPSAGFVWVDGYWRRRVTVTSGSGDIGSVLRLKRRTGRIRITTTIAKAGNGTKGIGTERTTTTAVGATMIVGGGMVITTIVGMSTTTSRKCPRSLAKAT